MEFQRAIRQLTSRLKNNHGGGGSLRRTRRGRPNNEGMGHFLNVLQLDKRFDLIHVTGTKGKGSTCAWTDALLRSHFRSSGIPGKTGPKVGLFTSPHIRDVRERIRVDFAPISEALFAERFSKIWETLLEDADGNEDKMPAFTQLLTLLSVDIFNFMEVQVGIYEVNIGGRWDSTNCWNDTVVCGFSTIGVDHVPKLGHTVEEIARNKAGIMKPGCLAFSVPQSPEVRVQLEAEAEAVGCQLTFTDDRQSRVPDTKKAGLKLQPMRNNVTLAIELANAYLDSRFKTRLRDKDITEAVSIYELTGRLQVVQRPGSPRWHLDIAHNSLSVPVALDWFLSEVQDNAAVHSERDSGRCDLQRPFSRRERTLIFGHQSSHRDTADIINAIVKHCDTHNLIFDRVVLASHTSYLTSTAMFPENLANDYSVLWSEMPGSPHVMIASLKTAIQFPESLQIPIDSDVLIVGSAHLVSSALAELEV